MTTRSTTSDLRKPGLLRRAIDWVFGYDFFISYAHGDGTHFPSRLKAQLEGEAGGFTVFLDTDVYTAGDELNRATRRRVRMSRELIVVCRPQALKSSWVHKEVQVHLDAGRAPLLININNALKDAARDSPLAQMAIDRAWLRIEEATSDPDGEPTERCIAELSRAFKATRQETRRLRFFASATLLFALVAAIAVAFGVLSVRNERQAIRNAHQSEMRQLLRAAQTAGEEHAELSLLLLAEATDVQRAGDLEDHELVAALHRSLNSAPARTIRAGTWGAVQQLRFSPDGTRFISASSDGTLRLWTPQHPEPQQVLKGHLDAITTVEFDASGQLLASGSSDFTIRLWNLRQEGEPRLLEGHTDSPTSLAFSPDGAKLVSAAYDGTIRIWNLRDGGEPVVLRGHQRPEVYHAEFDASGNYVVSASRDQTALVWRIGDGRPAEVLRGHEDDVRLARFNPDGSLIATMSSDSVVRLYTAPDGRPVGDLAGRSNPTAIAFSPDGTKLLVGRQDGSLRVWPTADFTNPAIKPVEAPRRLERHEGAIVAMRFSEDSTRFTTVGSQSIRTWTTDDGGRQQKEWRLGVPTVSEASISPLGTHVVTTSGDGLIRIWSLAEQHTHMTKWRKQWASNADLSPDGTRFVVADDNDAFIVELRSGGDTVILSSHTDNVQQAQFSPNGDKVLTASRDATLRLWSLGGSPVRTFEGHEDAIRDATFDSTGSRLASASDDQTAMVWDASSDAPPVILRGHLDTVTSIEFSPDDTQVLTSSWDGTARLWDSASGTELQTLRGHWDLLDEAVFSPDGLRVATASRDRTARIWDLADPSQSIVLSGHRGDLSSVSFSPNGRRLVTASRDGSARVWPADGSGEPIVLEGRGGIAGDAYFTADGSGVVVLTDDGVLLWRADGVGDPIALDAPSLMGGGSVQLSADGHTVMTASMEGVTTWSLSAAALRDAACQAVGRNLTAIEWSMHRYGPYRTTCAQWPNLSAWTPLMKSLVHGEMRVLSSTDRPETSIVTGRNLNLLFPRELRGTIDSVEATTTMAAPGQACSATVTANVGAEDQLICNAQVECNDRSIYGGNSAGFFPCTIAGPHVLGSDAQVSSVDGDPAIVMDTEAKYLRIQDDQAGHFGSFDIEVELERPRPPPSYVSSVPWGCMDGTGLAPTLPDEANHHAQSWLIPDRTPFAIDEIRYALVAPLDSVCRTGLAHNVVIGTMPDPGPGDRDRTGPPVVTMRIPETTERSLRPVRVPIDPPITLQTGQAAFVKIQLAASPDARHGLCLQTCQTGGRVGIDYWSGSASPPYDWHDEIASRSLQINHAVYGVDRGSAATVDRLLDLPGYQAIALHNFNRRSNLVKLLQNIVITDGIGEARRRALGYLNVEAMQRSTSASDEALIESLKASKRLLETLRDHDALACVQQMFPRPGIEYRLPPSASEHRDAMLNSLSNIIVSAEERPKTRVNAETAQQAIQHIVTAFGPDARYLAPPGAPPDEAQANKICATSIRLFEQILVQESSAAANTIRWMYMTTATALQRGAREQN